MSPASVGKFGTSLLSSVGAALVGGSRVWGRSATARANGPVWTECITAEQEENERERTDAGTDTGHSAVAGGALGALPPTTNVVGFRAVPL